MTREDIIKLAREAGLVYWTHNRWFMDAGELGEEIERFAALIAASEREAKDELLGALQDLLMDTQHSEHECDDKNCPVSHARRVALKYDTRGQA